jgi:hypothetical protein
VSPVARPRLSVVIPTRNRPHTLRFALQTCAAQDFDDCEIVVADNSDVPDATRETVGGFDDTRMKYVRSPKRLAMTDNWEFALSQATAEYVTIIGDDDGLLLHALPEIDRLLRLLDTPVLHWESVCYNWPDLPLQPHLLPNELLVPLAQVDFYYPIRLTDARPLMLDAANSGVSYARLPMIFGSAIHQSVVSRLRAITGRVFQSQSPDVYSAFAFGYLAGTYHSVAAPMTIAGLSGRSNGVAAIFLRGRSPITDEFRRLNVEARHGCHPRVPDLTTMAALVADSFQRARDALFRDDPLLWLDRQALVHHCLRELADVGSEEWRESARAIREAIQDDPTLLAWFEATHGERRAEDAPRRVPLPRYGGTYLNLDAADFGVTDVSGAAQLCEKLLGYQRDGVNAHVVPEHREPPPGASEDGPTGRWRQLRSAARRLAGLGMARPGTPAPPG